jgi:peptidoglycan/xylan/chitin deacetylase (PgdA/CDA1 family)
VKAQGLVLFLMIASAPAATREVAITIDDLPRGGDGGSRSLEAVRSMTASLLAPFQQQKIPVTGFVNAGRNELDPRGLREILDMWLDAGADLGNHTYTHADLNTMPLPQFEEDVVKGEPALRAALEARGKKLEFFRHPFGHTGPTPEIKRALDEFLAARGYRVAPFTFDNSDYLFAAAADRERARRELLPYLESVIAFFEKRSVEVAGHEFPQVMLLHANELNAEMMPEILAMFRRRGYAFVTLDHALRDEAYRLPDDYAGKGGFSWIHRWSMTRKMPNKGEPDEPSWLRQVPTR